ncbi:porin [Rhizobiales bacterium TNE-4]|nr:porin [Rhizobiales bacterium TNE-4]MBV1826714.1 porin [Rhizobiales bacterium TNE-4]
MKLVKSLLLGSAAGLAAVAGAQAADLPSKKAAPVEYVRVCSAHGAGFFYIPGSDTCIKLGGYVRAEYLGNQTWSRNSDPIGFYARGRLDIDTRTSTEYGLLRAFIRYQLTTSNGAYNRAIPAYDTNFTNQGATPALDKAFVQFVGFTAGRFSSFYDFYAAALNWGGTSLGSDRSSLMGLAYTYSFGSGFSGTISLEDPNASTVVANNYVQAGESMPDIVANLRVDQSWGSAQLSGVLHQVRPAYGANFTSGSSDYGWAIQGGVKFNLPMLAAGDQLWLQGAYGQGAMSYIGLTSTTLRVGNLAYTVSDAYFANNNVQMSTGYSLTAGFLHYWTPKVRQSLFGNYTQFDPTGSASQVNALASKANLWQVGSNVIFTPIKGLDVGAEIMWFNLDGSKTVASAKPGAPALSNDNGWQYRLRVQRDF